MHNPVDAVPAGWHCPRRGFRWGGGHYLNLSIHWFQVPRIPFVRYNQTGTVIPAHGSSCPLLTNHFYHKVTSKMSSSLWYWTRICAAFQFHLRGRNTHVSGDSPNDWSPIPMASPSWVYSCAPVILVPRGKAVPTSVHKQALCRVSTPMQWAKSNSIAAVSYYN